MMLDALLLRLIPAPATRDTLDDDPLRLKFVAVGTLGPTMLKELAPLLIVILAPATSETLLLVPFRLKLVAAAGVGPTIVIDDAPVFRVMFAPATSDRLLELPFSENCGAALEIVMDDAPVAREMPFPATSVTLPVLALREKLVPPGAGAIMLMLDAFCESVMFAPAMSETDCEIPFRLKLLPVMDARLLATARALASSSDQLELTWPPQLNSPTSGSISDRNGVVVGI